MEPTQAPSPLRQPVIEMDRLLPYCLMFLSVTAHAQTRGTMQVHLQVLPRVLSVSVSSSQLDFARQRANAGVVTIDPATGLSTHKVTGHHAMGEVIVHGPAQSRFLVSIDHATVLQQTGGSHEIRFTPAWAQTRGCQHDAFVVTHAQKGSHGVLGDDGCALLRFGGTIHLFGAKQGRYTGQLAVQITPL